MHVNLGNDIPSRFNRSDAIGGFVIPANMTTIGGAHSSLNDTSRMLPLSFVAVCSRCEPPMLACVIAC
jgi:hypothetical protein